MWARQNNEWWPAEVASVSEDGMLCVSFLGWDSRHNVWMDPPKADEVGGSCSTGIECAKVQL